MKTPDKDFDCVEMKRRAQERILRETAGMSPAQELAFWRTKEEAFRQAAAQRRQARKAG